MPGEKARGSEQLDGQSCLRLALLALVCLRHRLNNVPMPR